MLYRKLSKTKESSIEPDSSKYPRSIFLIIATEFCERFSFCGLRTILSLYLRNVLLFHENGATVIYHVFIMLCYFVPVVGAILADSYLGRFRTILYFSVIYAIGNILMCFAATPPIAICPVAMTYIGLILIAWGTGGIKPCVAAFGGDQFHLPQQQLRLQQFFSIFYFTINFGGFMGMVLTPILRKAFTCFGDDTCYALGFGFPAALMVTALFLFLLGKPLYRLKYPKENIMLNFINCVTFAAKRRFVERKSHRRENHWLDYAADKFPPKLIAEVKIVLAILFLYIPLPLFWSLFDQQGSRWTFQASRMNGAFLGTQLLPDQMQVINPAMVLMLIPLFDKSVYPWFEGRGLLSSPLHRMIVGGILAGLAFVTSGCLELKLEETYPVLPDRGEATLNFINTLQCDVGFLASFESDITLIAGERKVFNVTAHNVTKYDVYLVAPPLCWGVELENPTLTIVVTATESQVDTFVIGLVERDLKVFEADADEFKKSLSGRPKVRTIFLRGSRTLTNVTISLKSDSGLEDMYFVPNDDPLSMSAYVELEPGSFHYSVHYGNDTSDADDGDVVDLELGAVYTLVLREYLDDIVVSYLLTVEPRYLNPLSIDTDTTLISQFHKLFTMTPPNKIHMLWLIPQYLFISMAEVMFAISGLEFSFTQAPNSMKTVTIAAWYVSVALGNFMVIIITQARLFRSQAHEFFLFAGLILVNMVTFTAMVGRYNFVVLETDSSSTLNSKTIEKPEVLPLLKPTLIASYIRGPSVTLTTIAASTSKSSKW
ncbi:LOW QUALITY PROTEIN: solute carrier family 15 member 1-like [Diprion similis]|uniref:LOW QUALITY PROTEIN: solute carrier family 15 member 1-like n=1 Tax=Diprion similis TaxID=362088 RepID=UPI001EF83F5C|nr:LOW QUALITY PROTEIN: solute carrier family 15 member 1-like [Diprion similis]